MRKKAIILDLDNTIYLVSTIGDILFKNLFQLITESGEYEGDLDEIKSEIKRRPFQFVANDFAFSTKLKQTCMDLLNNLSFDNQIEPVENYRTLSQIACKKFLVTTGFTKLQESKIKQLGIQNDFEQIFIIDPDNSDLTKKDIFRKILIENNYQTEDLLVVGDDLHSEIKAAKELGIESVWYNFRNDPTELPDQKSMRNFIELKLHI